MMPIFSVIALVISLYAQGLTFSSPHTWFFTGMVAETRQVLVMGLKARVALVQSKDFDAWVILRTASQSAELADVILGEAQPGDKVRVSITGPHVSKNGVDWDLCQPQFSNYCRQGWLYDTGPDSGDWYLPVSPSNLLIHSDHIGTSLEYPLFWNIEVLKDAPALKRETCPQRLGLQTSRAHPCTRRSAAHHHATSLCHLVGQAFGSGFLEPK
jgi:hypothetical protein